MTSHGSKCSRPKPGVFSVLSWTMSGGRSRSRNQSLATRSLRSKPGSFVRYSARHSNQATKPDTLNPRMSATADPMSEPGKFSERLERERPLRFSAQCGDEVPRQARAFPDSVLGGRRTWLSGLAIHDPRAIADCPYTRVVEHLQEFVDHDPPTLFLARQRRDQRIRGARNGADERLCGDPLPIAEDGRFGRRRDQAAIKSNVDSSALKKVLR